MRLLVDTDVFYKLALSDLLQPLLDVLAIPPEKCARLPALPYMFKRGQLRNKLGSDDAARLLQIAEGLPQIPEARTEWLDLIVDPDGRIDAGEAQLFAVAADDETILLATGDKRAIRAIPRVPELKTALDGRILTLEMAMILLCDRLGTGSVRSSIQPSLEHDRALGICFRDPATDEALWSYQRNLETEVGGSLFYSPLTKKEGEE